MPRYLLDINNLYQFKFGSSSILMLKINCDADPFSSPLALPGYVQRVVEISGTGVVVNNFVEGLGWPQSAGSPLRFPINNVWDGQTKGIINEQPKKCGCQ